MAVGFGRWFAGDPFPAGLRIPSVAAALAAGVILYSVDLRIGEALLAGLVAGCMLGNVWAIVKARRNRTWTHLTPCAD